VTAATDALAALVQAMDDTRPECQNDPRFIADDTRASDLAPICDRCELFDLCETYARLGKPKAGVWAGRRWTGRNP
jgi:hypothetical protein